MDSLSKIMAAVDTSTRPEYIPNVADCERYRVALGYDKSEIFSTAEVVAWLKANPAGGMKFDGGKMRWGLVLRGMDKAVRGVVAVATFGAAKYAADSWQHVDNAQTRYEDGLHRHLDAIREFGHGAVDHDSGLLHWFHAAWNALALAWFAARDAEQAAKDATR